MGRIMYAVVVSGGKQYRVAPGATLVVDHVTAEVGSEHLLDQVLLVGGENVVVGTPTVAGAVVRATIVAHELGAKTESMRYIHRERRRKTKNGRAHLTVLKIDAIQA
jgi:large subunit ribosomal protein L21